MVIEGVNGENPPKTPDGLPTLPADERLAFNRLVPFNHGAAQKIIINRNDSMLGAVIGLFGEFSPGEVDVFRDVIGSKALVVEVGANIGAHTLALSEIAAEGQILAFEPQRLVFQALCGNLALNNISNVWAEQRAVGAKPGIARITNLDPRFPQNFGGLPINFSPDGYEVEQIAIDQLDLPKLDFLKLDCEGSEAEVLKGAAGTIARCKPWIYLEFDHHRAELLAILDGLGYAFARHFPHHAPRSVIASDMVLAWSKDQRLTPDMESGAFSQKHGFVPALPIPVLVERGNV